MRLRIVRGFLLALGAAAHSCTTDEGVVAPATGSLEVTTKTIGLQPDLDGYTVQLDGGEPKDIGSNAKLEYTGLAPGDHTIGLSGIAANCTLSSANPQTVSVSARVTTSVSFAVTCSTTVG